MVQEKFKGPKRVIKEGQTIVKTKDKKTSNDLQHITQKFK